ncbi:molybdate ABC transporter permease subunit [Lacrimispora sp.]|jgi:molybdate transport system permease protein|uniref:molybdate ABC transporter permease subunit n=1 Tax=Lacrimispora sp. TaxID=2719234 RepID=UPI0028AE9A04|nr:molybdate ABC transporter permease subunit [Lacrimispora sp.]
MWELISTIDFSPLFLSMKTGILATIFTFFLGTGAARGVMKLNHRTKSIVDGILTLPLVLPPTVAGFFLLLIFSLRRPFGAFLWENYHVKMVQTWSGCVMAAFVIAFPLMYRNARAAFEQVDVTMIYAGRTLGLSERKIFWKIIVPMAAPGLASGIVLSFSRAIGEYGATTMLAGNILGKTRTMPVAIASEVSAGNWEIAGFWVLVIVTISFIMVVFINLVSGKSNQDVSGW